MKRTYISTVASRTEALLYLQEHDLGHAHAYVSLMNSSNNVPYHNFDHLLIVTKWCGRLAGMLGLSKFETRALLLAAIFHDFAHSGGHFDDSVNVERAVEGLRKFCDIHRIDGATFKFAADCILVTEFPFVREPTNLAQQIIRDADLLQATEPNFEEVLLSGLRKEIEVKIKRKISKKEFAVLQLDFMDKQFKLFTKPAGVIYAAISPYVRDRFNRISGER